MSITTTNKIMITATDKLTITMKYDDSGNSNDYV